MLTVRLGLCSNELQFLEGQFRACSNELQFLEGQFRA